MVNVNEFKGKKYFDYIPREKFKVMSKVEQRQFLEKNSFSSLDQDQQDKYIIELKVIEKVLNSSEITLDIPNYINGRSTHINAQIILTSLWVHVKGLMELDEIHETLKCYETAIKMTAKEQLPLIEKLINKSLIPIDRIIPKSLFIMWCKKCWQYLQCAKMQKYPIIPTMN